MRYEMIYMPVERAKLEVLPPCGRGFRWGVFGTADSLPKLPPTLTLPREGGGKTLELGFGGGAL